MTGTYTHKVIKKMQFTIYSLKGFIQIPFEALTSKCESNFFYV